MPFLSRLYESVCMAEPTVGLLLSDAPEGHPASVCAVSLCVSICASTYAGDDALADYMESAICV